MSGPAPAERSRCGLRRKPTWSLRTPAPGVLARLGLGDEALKARNAGMIVVSGSAYGAEGPMATRPGYDIIAQAMGGVMTLQKRDPAGEPLTLPGGFADQVGAMQACVAALAAPSLCGRYTGKQPPVDIPGDHAQRCADAIAQEALMADSRSPVAQFFNDRFSIDEAVMETLLATALGRGGDFAELFFEHKRSGAISFEDEQVKSSSAALSQGVGIRVVKGDAIGYAYTEDLSLDAMRRAAETAAQVSAGEGSTTPVDVTAADYDADRYVVPVPTTEAPLADKVELIRRADRAARRHHPSIARVDVNFGDEEKRIMVAASNGRLVADFQPLVRFNITCLSDLDGSRRQARWGGGGRLGMEYFDAHRPEALAEEAARQAVLQQEAREAPAGTFPVILAAGDSGILLHEAVGHGLEADFNRKKTSNYSGRIGQSVASELVTVIDDATILNSRGSINVDDEGNPTRKNLLIEEGVLAAYMQDRISSKHFGVEPSGNGRRQSFKHYPMPRMTNTYMPAGESAPEDLIRQVDYGIYCKSFSGGQVNISNGDFVFSVTEGYLIEKGRITAPIRDVNLIGNGPDALSNVTGVGSDFQLSDGRWTCGKDGQSVPVGVGIPTVLISGLTVGGTQLAAGGQEMSG